MASQHILLAESRPNLQHSLGLMLKQADYWVSITKTTEEALSLAHALENTPGAVALLIVDLDSASLETCRAFTHNLATSSLTIPYLVLAEEIRDQAGDTLKKNGCLACITKPFEPKTLLQSVHDAFARLAPQGEHQPGRRPENTSAKKPMDQPE